MCLFLWASILPTVERIVPSLIYKPVTNPTGLQLDSLRIFVSTVPLAACTAALDHSARLLLAAYTAAPLRSVNRRQHAAYTAADCAAYTAANTQPLPLSKRSLYRCLALRPIPAPTRSLYCCQHTAYTAADTQPIPLPDLAAYTAAFTAARLYSLYRCPTLQPIPLQTRSLYRCRHATNFAAFTAATHTLVWTKMATVCAPLPSPPYCRMLFPIYLLELYVESQHNTRSLHVFLKEDLQLAITYYSITRCVFGDKLSGHRTCQPDPDRKLFLNKAQSREQQMGPKVPGRGPQRPYKALQGLNKASRAL